MKKESQNIEYKESWRDEYIKWICGFANAEGGKIFIGINDDKKITGISDATKLLEELPNKVRDTLGILVDVNLRQEKKLEYIEINVDAYPYPVNYKGQYHYRTGSTKQELKGQALDRFLLQKQGKRWDGVPVPGVKLIDLKEDTFKQFKIKAAQSKRVSADILSDGNSQLIEDLHLKEGRHLKRAAILLFHPDPEKYITGAYIKIGFFEGDDELKFQDEIHGNIFEQIEKTEELLFTKYIKAVISYKGVSRIESYEYPREAIREALLNAIAHKDYSGENPIQISVYEDKLLIWNEGQLPEHWTIDNLKKKHPSKPFNPDIANALSRSGYIEAWGRGTIKMIQECKKHHLPEPAFYFHTSGFNVEFRKDIYIRAILEEKHFEPHLIEILLLTKKQGSINNSQVQVLCSVSKRTATRYLSELEEQKHLVQSGETGKGTRYILKGSQRGQNAYKGAIKGSGIAKNELLPEKIQRGHKGAKASETHEKKDTTVRQYRPRNIQKTPETSAKAKTKDATKAPKAPRKSSKLPVDDLDLKLMLLETELNKGNPNDQIKDKLDTETFFKIYDTWLSELLEKAIVVGQKFNHLFAELRHSLVAINGHWSFNFTTADSKTILKTFRKQAQDSKHDFYNRNILIQLSFYFHAMKQTGLRTFSSGCFLEVSFSNIGYKVHVIENANGGHVSPEKPEFEYLLHHPLNKKEINMICTKLGDTIYAQIEKKVNQIKNQQNK